MIFKKAWDQRSKLLVEGSNLYAKGFKLRAEGEKLIAERNRLYAEGDKLYAEAVMDFFELGAAIDWKTGNAEGKPLPIPASEVGL